ncbi:MAG: hypothetical protein ACJ74Z_19235 [Bryobacteraceae bacterium]
MADSAEERHFFLSEATRYKIQSLRSKADSRRKKALAGLVNTPVEKIARIFTRSALEEIRAYAGPALTEVCCPRYLAFFLQTLKEERIRLLDEISPVMAALGLPESSRRFEYLIYAECDKWAALGFSRISKYARQSQGQIAGIDSSNVPDSAMENTHAQTELAIARRAIVEPILEGRPLSINELANEIAAKIEESDRGNKIHADTIRNYLNGKVTPHESTRRTLAKALNISPLSSDPGGLPD